MLSCVQLFGTPPGSSVHGIFQARILEWVAISYSRESSRPRDRTRVSCISCNGRWILYHCATWAKDRNNLNVCTNWINFSVPYIGIYYMPIKQVKYLLVDQDWTRHSGYWRAKKQGTSRVYQSSLWMLSDTPNAKNNGYFLWVDRV